MTAAKSTFNGAFVSDIVTIVKAVANTVGWLFDAWVKYEKAVLPAVVSDIKGAFQMIRGVVEFFAGLFTLDFGKMWQGIKDIFGGAFKEIKSMFQAFGAVIALVASNVWDGLKTGLIDVVNFIIGAVRSVLTITNQMHFSTPFGDVGVPQIALPSYINTAPSIPAGSGTRAPVGGHGHMQGPGAQTQMASGWNHGDIVVNVGHEHLARITRKQIINAMAAGA